MNSVPTPSLPRQSRTKLYAPGPTGPDSESDRSVNSPRHLGRKRARNTKLAAGQRRPSHSAQEAGQSEEARCGSGMSPVPRYGSFQPSSETASRIKRRVGSRGTRSELLLRRALWAEGLRYRLHRKDLPGKPDIVFPRQKIAVFCDGDFWHGRYWPALQEKLRSRANPDYWIPKIQSNIDRDARNRPCSSNSVGPSSVYGNRRSSKTSRPLRAR